jgi:hypothetical protein
MVHTEKGYWVVFYEELSTHLTQGLINPYPKAAFGTRMSFSQQFTEEWGRATPMYAALKFT